MLALRYFRIKRGLSQDVLAALLNTRQATISAIEHGKEQPSDELLHGLASVLGVTPAYLLLRPVTIKEQVFIAGSDEQVVA